MSPVATGGRRRQQKAETRARLLAAAREVFAEKGYAKATVGDVAARAEVAHGTLYVHFPSKEAVLDELLGDLNAGLALRLLPVVELAGASDRAIVAELADRFLAFLEGERDVVGWVAERIAGRLGVRELKEGVNPPVFALVEAALASRALPGADPALVAVATHALLAMWIRVGLGHALGPNPDRSRAATVLTALTLGGLDQLREELSHDRGRAPNRHAPAHPGSPSTRGRGKGARGPSSTRSRGPADRGG